jgi:hypothetical protein
MNIDLKWTATYDANGGYDCITPAYIVKHGNCQIFVIDEKEFTSFVGMGSDADKCKKKAIATTKEYADYVVNCLNKHEAYKSALRRIEMAKPDGLSHEADIAIIERASRIASKALLTGVIK